MQREFSRLVHLAYEDPNAPTTWNADEPLHDPGFQAHSFFIREEDGRLIGYAAVLSKTIRHDGQTLAMAGLSCVATHPSCRGQGIAGRVVRAASLWLAASGADIGLFTCDPNLSSLYVRAGDWQQARNIVLQASAHGGALRSDTLGKTVMVRLLTDKARLFPDRQGMLLIDLDFPPGQFI